MQLRPASGWAQLAHKGLLCRPGRNRAPQRRLSLTVSARDRPRRLISLVLSAPRRLEKYFERVPLRKALWCGISTATGFYAANIVTLSFGALAINDILAGLITVAFYEVVTKLYYEAERPTLRLLFLNCFKIGLVAALLADALKLGT